MRGRSPITLLSLAALAVAWSAVASGGTAAGYAAIVPILVLLAPLLLRRYPGEERIARLRGDRRPARRRARATETPPPRRDHRATTARGSLLLGRRLAVRPPPGRPAHA